MLGRRANLDLRHRVLIHLVAAVEVALVAEAAADRERRTQGQSQRCSTMDLGTPFAFRLSSIRSFALPDRARMLDSSTLTRARRKPPLAGHRYDLGPVVRAARQQNTHLGDLREIVAAARRPELYEALAAPDRIAGRFELPRCTPDFAASVGCVGRRRRRDRSGSGGQPVRPFRRHAARDRDPPQIGVSKRLKAMGSAFYGRNAAYAAALDDASPDDLAAALARNVYGGKGPGAVPKAEALARLYRFA